jgi:hypothetical protein
VCKVHVGGGWDGWGVRVRAHRRLAFVFPSRIHAVRSTPSSWLRQEARAIRKEDGRGERITKLRIVHRVQVCQRMREPTQRIRRRRRTSLLKSALKLVPFFSLSPAQTTSQKMKTLSVCFSSFLRVYLLGETREIRWETFVSFMAKKHTTQDQENKRRRTVF